MSSYTVDTGNSLYTNLVCFLPCDETSGTTLEDISASGTQHNATLGATGNTFTTFDNKNVVQVVGDGTNWIEIPDHSDFGTDGESFSFDVWVHVEDNNSTWNELIGKGYYPGWSLVWAGWNGQMNVYIRSDDFSTGETLAEGLSTLTHIAVVYDHANLQLNVYKNGTLASSSPHSVSNASTIDGGTTLDIGGGSDTTIKLGRFRFWRNRVLGSSEITALYTNYDELIDTGGGSTYTLIAGKSSASYTFNDVDVSYSGEASTAITVVGTQSVVLGSGDPGEGDGFMNFGITIPSGVNKLVAFFMPEYDDPNVVGSVTASLDGTTSLSYISGINANNSGYNQSIECFYLDNPIAGSYTAEFDFDAGVTDASGGALQVYYLNNVASGSGTIGDSATASGSTTNISLSTTYSEKQILLEAFNKNSTNAPTLPTNNLTYLTGTTPGSSMYAISGYEIKTISGTENNTYSYTNTNRAVALSVVFDELTSNTLVVDKATLTYTDNTIAFDYSGAVSTPPSLISGTVYSETGETPTSPQTVAYDSSSVGSDRVLIATVTTELGNNGVSAISYGGQAMTLLASRANTINTGAFMEEVFVYYLLDPPTGSNTFSVSFTSDSNDWAYHLATFQNVDQSTPFGTPVTDEYVDETSLTLNITTTSNNSSIFVTGVINAEGNGPFTPVTDTTELTDVTIATGSLGFSAYTAYREGVTAGTYTVGEVATLATQGSANNAVSIGVEMFAATATSTSYDLIVDNNTLTSTNNNVALLADRNITSGVYNYSYTFYDVNPIKGYASTIDNADFNYTNYDQNLIADRILTSDNLNITYTNYPANFLRGYAALVDNLDLNYTTYNVIPGYGRVFPIDNNSITYAEYPVNLKSDRKLVTTTGNVSYTYYDISPYYGRNLITDTSSLSYSQYESNFLINRSALVDTSNLTYVDYNVALGNTNKVLLTSKASFTYTGYDSALIADRVITSDVSSINYTTYPITPAYNRVLSTDNSSLFYNDFDLTVAYGRSLPVTSSSFIYNDGQISFYIDHSIAVDKSAILYSDYDVFIVAGGYLNITTSNASYDDKQVGLLAERALVINADNVFYSDQNIILSAGRYLTLDADDLLYASYDTGLKADRTVSVENNNLVFNYYDITPQLVRKLAVDNSTLLFNDYQAELSRTYGVPITTGSLSYTNYTVYINYGEITDFFLPVFTDNLNYNFYDFNVAAYRNISFTAGGFLYKDYDAGLSKQFKSNVDTNNLIYNNKVIDFLYSRGILIDSDQAVYNDNILNLKADRRIVSTKGVFLYQDYDAQVRASRNLPAQTFNYIYDDKDLIVKADRVLGVPNAALSYSDNPLYLIKGFGVVVDPDNLLYTELPVDIRKNYAVFLDNLNILYTDRNIELTLNFFEFLDEVTFKSPIYLGNIFKSPILVEVKKEGDMEVFIYRLAKLEK